MCPQVQSQKPPSATTILAHMRTAPGKKDQESPLLLRISSSETPAFEIVIRAQMNTRQSSSSRHISTSSVQRGLSESGLYGQIAAKITLLKGKATSGRDLFGPTNRRN